MVNNLCVIIRQPLGSERFTLGLRTALAAQAGGFETDLVFLGDSLFSLTGALPTYLAQTLAAFQENEGRVHCLQEELAARGIGQDQLLIKELNPVDRDGMSSLLEDSDSINVF